MQPEKYEQRLRGLLDAFQLALELGAPVELMSRFLVMGGECNYLLGVRVERMSVRLEPIPGSLWKNGRWPTLCCFSSAVLSLCGGVCDRRGVRWSATDIRHLLDTAEACLRENAASLGLEVAIIRKERAVGKADRLGLITRRLGVDVRPSPQA